jgi:hypothetical protein
MKNTFWIITIAMLLGAHASHGEVMLGLTSGVSLSGEQDHKFKEYNSLGEVARSYTTDDIHENTSMLSTVRLSAWGNRDIWQHFGIQLEASSWSLTTEVNNPAYKAALPFTSVTQERTGLMVNMIGRLPLFSFGNKNAVNRRPYLFGGIGGGPLYTRVQHGQQEWQYGCQALGGVSIPLSPRSRFRLESRYLLARDADITNPQEGWHVETSGTPTSLRLGRHWDTRFVGVTFGLDWRF